MTKNARPSSNRIFWIIMACCAVGAITLIALLLSGEIEGERVVPNIEHKSK